MFPGNGQKDLFREGNPTPLLLGAQLQKGQNANKGQMVVLAGCFSGSLLVLLVILHI